ncbi:MAG TPA: hypothetical protein ENI51_06520 [Candidatus Atribacteria bacterium]|nr:hypothetical protein [Candidatus Atribacteria bacterium]
MFIEFYWGNKKDEMFLVSIEREDGKEVNIEKIEQLLDKYRETDEAYNSNEWIDFLEENGYIAEIIEPDTYMYF